MEVYKHVILHPHLSSVFPLREKQSAHARMCAHTHTPKRRVRSNTFGVLKNGEGNWRERESVGQLDDGAHAPEGSVYLLECMTLFKNLARFRKGKQLPGREDAFRR